jgi:hypothetical protein
MKNMTEMIKNLPPLLREEVIGESLKSIKEEAEKKAKESLMYQIRRDAEIVVEDVTEKLVRCHSDGTTTWSRPDYTKNIDDELYYTFVHISEQFVHKYAEQIVFTPRRRRTILSDEEKDEDEDEDEEKDEEKDEDEDEDDRVYGSEYENE